MANSKRPARSPAASKRRLPKLPKLKLGFKPRLPTRAEWARSPAVIWAALKIVWAYLKHVFLPPKRIKRPVLKPYVRLDALWRKFAIVLTPIVLGLFCLVYGFYFALTAPYLIVIFAAPIMLLVLASIWALPDRPHAPTKTMEFLFAAMLISLVLWPNYLALALPGPPWITAIRLTGMPMAALFLVSVSTSRPFRKEMRDLATTVPGLWVWFTVFLTIQVVTVVMSNSPAGSIQKTVIQQVNWTIMAAATAWICRVPGRAERYVLVLMLTALPIMALAFLEYDVHHLLWAGYVPSFLKIDDPTAVSIFASQLRAATGQYRTKVTFSTALGMAEYISLLTPFAVHYALGRYRLLLKAFGFLMVPVIFYGVRMTDARLGVIGFLVSIMLYLLIWGMLRFRRNRRDLLAATIVYAYPMFFAVSAAAVTLVKPVRTLVFGGGAQTASNEARNHQILMAIPKMMFNPFGHGSGGAGSAMGYGAGEFIAIDNYYLVIGLDYGMIGIVTFIGVFMLTISWSVRSALTVARGRNRETTLLIPLAISMTAFLVIKMVFGQADLHPLMFMMLGMSVALIHRVREDAKASLQVTPVAVAEPRPPDSDELWPGDEHAEPHPEPDAAPLDPSRRPRRVRIGG